MKLIKTLFIALIVLAGLLVAGGFFLPAQIHVERVATIDATPGQVFPLINNLRNFNRWSPWAKLDPDTEFSYEGPAAGEGARMIWKSDDRSVGSGSMQILESISPRTVRSSLDFGPKGSATTEFTLTPQGNGTLVAWAFDTDLGRNPLMRYMGLFFDDMIGSDYDKGLRALKNLAENPAAPEADEAV